MSGLLSLGFFSLSSSPFAFKVRFIFFKLLFTHLCLDKKLFKPRGLQAGGGGWGGCCRPLPNWTCVKRLSVRAGKLCDVCLGPVKTGKHKLVTATAKSELGPFLRQKNGLQLDMVHAWGTHTHVYTHTYTQSPTGTTAAQSHI